MTSTRTVSSVRAHVGALEAARASLTEALGTAEPVDRSGIARDIASIGTRIDHASGRLAALPGAQNPIGEVRMCQDRRLTGPALPTRHELTPPPIINAQGVVPVQARQALAGATDVMWDVGSTLTVNMTGGSAFVHGKVRQFAQVWEQYANIHFDFVDGPAQIKIAFDPPFSWSCIGREALWVPFNYATMNYGWFDHRTPDAEFSRVVLHEFGHALGLIHEHQSPVAGIAWDREKVYAYFAATNNWDRAKVDQEVFAKYAVTSTNYSQFDPLSIMEYYIPASLTLDGHGVSGGTTLSPTDIEYIRKWYPASPTAAAANGLLRTGDDADEIDFLVEYNAVPADGVEFSLAPASGLTWWKAIEIPIGTSGYQMLQMQDGSSALARIAKSDLDVSRPMRFWKAKFAGIHTRLQYSWDVMSGLPGGSRLSLVWKRDSR